MPNRWKRIFFTWHIVLEVGKTQDMPSKICHNVGDALSTAFWITSSQAIDR
jgi:hypothetical protein